MTQDRAAEIACQCPICGRLHHALTAAREEGRREGLEAAAQWHEAQAAMWEDNRAIASKRVQRLDNSNSYKAQRDAHTLYATIIRELNK